MPFDEGHPAARRDALIEQLEATGRITAVASPVVGTMVPERLHAQEPRLAAACSTCIGGSPPCRRHRRRHRRRTQGFETPYGLELLGTVHWIATHEADPRQDVAGVLDRLRAWSRRKGDLFTEHHVTVALDRLTENGWLQPAAS